MPNSGCTASASLGLLPQKALELQPEATRVAHMLAQLQLAAGDANGEGTPWLHSVAASGQFG